MAARLALAALLPLLLRAMGVASAVTPTAPGGADQVFYAGQTCSFSWDLDSTGSWTTFDVDLMSGSNYEMVNVTRVASEIDGTQSGTYEFQCPEVTPNAPIYFYQFTSNGQDPQWTSRFTIGGADGSTVDAENPTEPDGQAIPWGIGSLVDGATTTDSSLGSQGWVSAQTTETTTTATTTTGGWWGNLWNGNTADQQTSTSSSTSTTAAFPWLNAGDSAASTTTTAAPWATQTYAQWGGQSANAGWQQQPSVASSAQWGQASSVGWQSQSSASSGQYDTSSSSSSAAAWNNVNNGGWSPTSTSSANYGGAWATTSSAGLASPTMSAGVTGFQQGQVCSSDSQCPFEAPCCSELGFCGSGRNCLAGCNPLASYQPGACAAVPACQSGDYSLNYWSKDRILTNSSVWNGDAQSYDWLVDSIGNPNLGAYAADGSTGQTALTLSLTEQGNGTVITSTRSMLYGNVTAKVKSVAGAGILTAFTLVSGTKDQIDFEWTTNATDVAQTAYFYRGELNNYATGQQVNGPDRASDYHEYTISWMPDAITWLIDGYVVRNVSRASTADPSIPSLYNYPRTPSRIQFSIWPAGREGNPNGLVAFAGGNIDWTAPEYASNGYYASYVSAVNVQCFDASQLPYFTMSSNTAMSGSFDSAAGINGAAVNNAAGSSSSLSLGWSGQTSAANWGAQGGTAASATLVGSYSSAGWQAGQPDQLTAASAVDARVGTTMPTGWSAQAAKKRRRVLAALSKRADGSTIGSYSYGDLDDNGQLQMLGSDAASTITGDAWTGLNAISSALSSPDSASATGSAISSGTSSGMSSATSGSASTASGTASSSAASSTSTTAAESLSQKWDSLGTAVKAFVVVLIVWCWRRNLRKRGGVQTPAPDMGGSYARINDMGEMVPAGATYTSQGPYDDAARAPASGTPLARSSSRTANTPIMASLPKTDAASLSRSATSASASSKYQGGYIPSSQLRKEFGFDAPAQEQV
ncbi:hypothetical protein JCM10207_005638 [Rhodosporidiobolus poonsookiae]